MPVQGIPNSVDWIEFLKLRRDKATDPEDIAKLDNFIEHLAAEFSHDWDTTMDTMAPAGCPGPGAAGRSWRCSATSWTTTAAGRSTRG